MKIFQFISDALYTLASVGLMIIAVAMIAYAGWEVWAAAVARSQIINKMLDAIGLLVISMAVFDVAKYLMEEEVLRNRELRSPLEARETLTKFMVIIAIAVSLEALVFIFGAGKEDVRMLFYPTLLLFVSALLMVALGLYQLLSVTAEERRTRPAANPQGNSRSR